MSTNRHKLFSQIDANKWPQIGVKYYPQMHSNGSTIRLKKYPQIDTIWLSTNGRKCFSQMGTNN